MNHRKNFSDADVKEILNLIGQMPPHEVIVYVCRHAGLDADELANHHCNSPLTELLANLQERFTPKEKSKPTNKRIDGYFDDLSFHPIRDWLVAVRRNLGCTLREILREPEAGLEYNGLLDTKTGETLLAQYFDQQQALEQQRKSALNRFGDKIQKDLVLAAKQGNQAAKDLLFREHEKRIIGYIKIRVRHKEDAKDLINETWQEVWGGLGEIDPLIGNFGQFATGCARNVLLRYWHEQGGNRPPSSDDPDGNTNQGGGDISDWFPPPSDVEFFNKLIMVTFGGASPPHQLVAFGNVRLLEWTPSQVFEELSGLTLKVLVQRLERDLLQLFEGYEEIVRASLQNLNKIMHDGTTVAAALRTPQARAPYLHLMDGIVADTFLQDYYTSNADPRTDEFAHHAAANITNWWASVQTRVINDIADEEPQEDWENM